MSTSRTINVGTREELLRALANLQTGDIIRTDSSVISGVPFVEHRLRGSNIGVIIIDEVHDTQPVQTATNKPNRGPYASHETWKGKKHHG